MAKKNDGNKPAGGGKPAASNIGPAHEARTQARQELAQAQAAGDTKCIEAATAKAKKAEEGFKVAQADAQEAANQKRGADARKAHADRLALVADKAAAEVVDAKNRAADARKAADEARALAE